jgi:peptidoglycan hydrolase-like protein with peptidoglycan-binding domain
MKSQRMTINIIILVLSFFMLPGIYTTAAAKNPPAKLISIDTDKAPPELVMVISAIVLEMRGQPQPKGDWPEIVFSRGITKELLEPQFRYAGFKLLQTIVDEYLTPDKNNGLARLKGHFHFLDAAKRRTIVALETEYKLTSKNIIIKKAKIRPIYPFRPEMNLFIVPAEKVTKKEFEFFSNNALTLGFILNNCVSAGKPGQVPKGIRDYYVFAFYLDRLSPDDQTELRLSRTPNGIKGKTLAFREPEGIVKTGYSEMHIDHSGWHVDIARCRISLTGEKLYIKAIFKAGRKKNNKLEIGKPVLAGAFSTRLAKQVSDPLIKKTQLALINAGYDPGPADGFMGRKTYQAIERYKRDQKPIVFAKPTRDQIKKVQLGLAKKGYKPGAPDGIMGKGTRRAIVQYQRDNAMTADGKVSASLLRKLESQGSRTALKTGALKVSSLLPEQKRLKSSLKTKMWPNELKAP